MRVTKLRLARVMLSLVVVALAGVAQAGTSAQRTAGIMGRVTHLQTGRPLRRVVIRVVSPTLSSPRRVSTNADGRYEVRDLPPGEYSLEAERPGYLTLAYGQRRPGERGKTLRLTEAETATAIDFALPPVGTIAGRIVDETGEPMAHVSLWAMQVRYYQGARKLVPVGGLAGHSGTDDSGQYLLVLPPGEFVVMAQSRETWPLERDPAQTFAYAPSFYPGVTAAAEARRVKLAVGQEVTDIDFALVPGRAAKITGTVIDAAGRPVAGESVTLSQEIGGPELSSVFPSTNAAKTGPDGRFTLLNVQAGDYVLAVRLSAAGGQPAQEARQMLDVNGADIDGLVMVTGSGGSVRGRVVSADATPVPGLDRLTVRARSLLPAAGHSTLAFSGNGRVNSDGTFEVKALFGPVVLTIGALTDDWTLKTVESDGRDVADDPIDVPHGATVDGVRIVVTNRPTHVRGSVLNEQQEPADGTVVIFPEETSRWREESRRVRTVRPDQRGAFSIKGLPAGKYLIAAVDYVQEGQWFDPQFLADLRAHAAPLSLDDGETRRIDVTVRK